MKIMALNVYANGSFERLYKLWVWMPMQMMALNAMKMMALNAYENYGGSERLCKWWLWMPMKMMALNAYENGVFECLSK